MEPITRRRFLTDAAAITAGAALLSACSSGAKRRPAPRVTPSTLPGAAHAPFDTVVVLTMENRSFDHLLGWLPGADGKQANLTYVDTAGRSHSPWHIAPDWQGWTYADPKHDWQSVATQWDNGK